MPSILEAIDKKYGKEEGDSFDLDLPIAIYVPKKSPRNSIPSLLVLNDCDIETAGDEQELEKKCQGVEELDLAQNKLSRWTEVCDKCKAIVGSGSFCRPITKRKTLMFWIT